MFDKSKQMELGDLFSNTFKLFKETFSRNIIIAIVFLLPAGIILAYGFDSLFSSLMESVRSAAEARYEYSEPDFTLIFKNLGVYIFTFLVFLFAYLAAMIGITSISYRSAEGEKINLGEAFSKIFSVTYFRSVGQSLILSLVLMACYLPGILIIIIGSSTDLIFVTVIGVFILIAGIAAIIYLVFRWYFAFVSIVSEDKKVFESFTKSSFLVNGNWWRTFGIILLFSILIDFAISIIITPVYFIAMWDFLSQYFQMIAAGNINEEDPDVIFKMMDSLGFAIGVVLVLSTLLDALITPVFNVVYYFDLKIRKKDFPELITPENTTGLKPPQ